MEYNLTCLLWLLFAAAIVLAALLKRQGDQQLDAATLKQAVELGGRYQRRIQDYLGRPLRWIISGETYELCSDDALLASLFLESTGRLARAQCSDGVWLAHYDAWWSSSCTISRPNTALSVATWKTSLWTGRGSVTFASGRHFSFRGGKCYNAANQRLITFGVRGRGIVLEPAATALPELALLVLLGSSLLLQSLDYSND